MANVTGNYTIEYYAREALMWLKNKKGMARLVNRRPENERNNSFEFGDKIKMRRPSTFTAAEHVAGTGTTTQDINAQNIQLDLDQHYEVKFQTSDRELAYAGPKLMNEHIGPAVDAVVQKIEQTIFALGAKVGPLTDINAATAAEDMIVPPRKTLLTNKTPMTPGSIFYAVDPSLAALFLADPIFHAAQVVGAGNQNALIDGTLGRRFGVDIFESQLAERLIAIQTATLAAAAAGGDEVGAIDSGVAGGYPVNTSSIVVDALTDGETLSVTAPDTFTIAGDPTVYVVTAVSGAVAGNEITLTIYPPLQKPAAENAVVTFNNRKTVQDAGGTRENLMFHRDAFALAMAPLPVDGNGAGAQIFTATDEETGLSIRLRKFYLGDTATVRIAVDALWGVQVLNPMLATRVIRAQ